PERILAGLQAQVGEPKTADTEAVTTLIENLLAWARSKHCPVVLGLPRFALSRLDDDRLRRCPSRMFAADLFSDRYRYRAEECERRLGRRLPFRDVLFPLLSANSAALPSVAAEILGSLPTRPSWVDSQVD